MSKPKTEVSPAGIAGWVCVTKPSTKFDPDGAYSVDLILAEELVEPLRELWKPLAEEAKAKALAAEKDGKKKGAIKLCEIALPGSPEMNEDGDPTGNVVLKFKAKAKITPKNGKPAFEKKVGIFDAKGKPITNVNLGKGSKLKVAYEVVPYCSPGLKKYGVSLRLSAVQVIELVKYVPGGDASQFGFGAEEGYAHEDAPAGFGGESTYDGAPAPTEDDAARTSKEDGTGDF